MASDLIETIVNGVDLKARRIYFGVALDWMEEEPGEVNGASVEFAVRALHRMAQDAPGKPVELHMSSYGGDAQSMLRLYDEVLACPCQIKFIGGGVIMSAATWVMVACDERYLHPNTRVMVHDGWSSHDGKHTDHMVYAKDEARFQELLYDIYAANTRMPRTFWQEVCQRDLYLSASEAVSLGMADKIIEPKKRGNLRKVRQAALKKAPSAAEIQKLVGELYARINRLNSPKIVINPAVKEPADPAVVVDDRPVEVEKAPVAAVATTGALPNEPK
jgi:ATP-dependent protease ClpP protease subunit